MASGGSDNPDDKKIIYSRNDPDFLHEQMLVSGMYGLNVEDEEK